MFPVPRPWLSLAVSRDGDGAGLESGHGPDDYDGPKSFGFQFCPFFCLNHILLPECVARETMRTKNTCTQHLKPQALKYPPQNSLNLTTEILASRPRHLIAVTAATVLSLTCNLYAILLGAFSNQAERERWFNRKSCAGTPRAVCVCRAVCVRSGFHRFQPPSDEAVQAEPSLLRTLDHGPFAEIATATTELQP